MLTRRNRPPSSSHSRMLFCFKNNRLRVCFFIQKTIFLLKLHGMCFFTNLQNFLGRRSTSCFCLDLNVSSRSKKRDAAKGAGCVGGKPMVNATHVKSMTTRRYLLKPILSLVVPKTHRTSAATEFSNYERQLKDQVIVLMLKMCIKLTKSSR